MIEGDAGTAREFIVERLKTKISKSDQEQHGSEPMSHAAEE